MSILAQNIGGALQVFTFQSIPAFAADLPPRDLFIEDFSEAVETEGISVTTAVPTSKFSTLNDLASGWEGMSVTSSAATAILKTVGHDHQFNVTQWDTIGQAKLLNTFGNVLGKQVANGLTVKVFNNITSSAYTTTMSVPTASQFVFAAPTASLQYAGELLDKLEVPQGDRYVIMAPEIYYPMINSDKVYTTYAWGDKSMIRDNGYQSTKNSAWIGASMAGFNVFKSPRLYNPLLPYGGDYYTNNDKLLGFAGNRAAMMVAARAPHSLTAPGFYSYTGTEPTSGWPFMFTAVLDPSGPSWRFGIYTLMGTAVANTNALVEIISTN